MYEEKKNAGARSRNVGFTWKKTNNRVKWLCIKTPSGRLARCLSEQRCLCPGLETRMRFLGLTRCQEKQQLLRCLLLSPLVLAHACVLAHLHECNVLSPSSSPSQVCLSVSLCLCVYLCTRVHSLKCPCTHTHLWRFVGSQSLSTLFF